MRGVARLWSEKKGTAPRPISVARFAVDHGMEKVEISRSTRSPKPAELGDVVYCVGEGTAFQLSRRAGQTSYEVRGIGANSSEHARYVSAFGRFLYAHHGIMGRPMTQVMASPGFEMIRAEAIEKSGKRLLKIYCVFGAEQPKVNLELVVDPADGWVLRSCRFQLGDQRDFLSDFEVEYGPPRDGIPLPRLVKLDEHDGIIHHCEFTEWGSRPTPLSEFNMMHYGLPDLASGTRRRIVLPYWLAGLAALLGSIALGLWRYASRAPRGGRA